MNFRWTDVEFDILIFAIISNFLKYRPACSSLHPVPYIKKKKMNYMRLLLEAIAALNFIKSS